MIGGEEEEEEEDVVYGYVHEECCVLSDRGNFVDSVLNSPDVMKQGKAGKDRTAQGRAWLPIAQHIIQLSV